MTDWKADLDALVQESIAFAKSIPVEPPKPRTIVEPNRMPPVSLDNSERDEIRARFELQGASGALRAGTGGLRSVPAEKDAGQAESGRIGESGS